jgi:hypothetical protein
MFSQRIWQIPGYTLVLKQSKLRSYGGAFDGEDVWGSV